MSAPSSSSAAPPPACVLSSSSLTFLSDYATTQRFKIGTPSSFSLSPNGAYLYFLRAGSASDRAQNVYQLDIASGGVESMLVRAEDLVASESLIISDEERKLRERLRLTSRGILSFQQGPPGSNFILIPYQQHLYTFNTHTRSVVNLTKSSPFLANMGTPSYPIVAPDGQRIAFVRKGDIFIIDVAAPAASNEYRLTFTGLSSSPHLSNGVSDFISQEEIGRFQGMYWCPDSSSLLYQHTDNTDVETLSILDLANPSNPPSTNAYPRPGKANAKVTMGIIRVERPEARSNGSASASVDATMDDATASRKRRRSIVESSTSSDAAAASSSSSSMDDCPPTPRTSSASSFASTTWLQWDHDYFPYVCSVVWKSSGPLTLVLQNRLQTNSTIMVVDDLSSGLCRPLLSNTDDRWVNLDHSTPVWIDAGKHFLCSIEDEVGFASLTLFDAHGKKVRALHDANEVQYRSLITVDEARGVCYVTGSINRESSATEQHVWCIPLGVDSSSSSSSSSPRVSVATPLTQSHAIHNCVIVAGSNVYVHASHSLDSGSKYVVREFELSSSSSSSSSFVDTGRIICAITDHSPSIPADHMPRVQLMTVRASESLAFDEDVRSDAMVEHDRLTNPMTIALSNIVPKKTSLLDVAEPPAPPAVPLELTFNVAILRPRDYDATKRYPLICYVYGGPGHRLVTCDRSSYYVAQFIANQGYIVIVTDNRGTPYRGAAFEKAIKGNYMRKPLMDQVMSIKAVAALDASIDLSRGCGIFGWSFGGYMSALAVMVYPSVFTCAFVGAPVCDWRWYDTNYTERVLGLPLEREADYDRSSVLTYAHRLLRPMMLVHGAADDNVYFAHAIQMSGELFKYGRQHVFLPLAGTHMLSAPADTISMYSRLATFMKEHVKTD